MRCLGSQVKIPAVTVALRYEKAEHALTNFLFRHAPIYLWYTLTMKGYHGMRKDVEKCLRNAHILKVIQQYGSAPGI